MTTRFFLSRTEDESGVSGTGHVADGVRFSNGKTVLCWTTSNTSVAVYDDMATMIAIHGHGGKTVVEWIDKPPS